MDLRIYFEKVRAMQAKITDEFPLVASVETGDGGKPGVVTEVSRALAARRIVDGAARMATAAEAKAYRDGMAAGRRAAEEAEAAKKVQVTVLSASALDRLAGKETGGKG